MIKSMTGFGSKEAQIAPFGKISIEIRSSNHKFLESVFHLPEGFLSLEDRIKKLIEAKIKRGRLTCAINIAGGKASSVFINKALLKNYLSTINNIRKQFSLKDEPSLDTLLHLPGILTFAQDRVSKEKIWPRLKVLLNSALDELAKARSKEGKALYVHLKNRAEGLNQNLGLIRARFKIAIQEKASQMATDEERSNFLKDSDITEEIERLAFHIRNLKSKLAKTGPIGKELDFIAQEMQREANTLAAKTFDSSISGRVVQIKSQIEKIREQVQNIE